MLEIVEYDSASTETFLYTQYENISGILGSNKDDLIISYNKTLWRDAGKGFENLGSLKGSQVIQSTQEVEVGTIVHYPISINTEGEYIAPSGWLPCVEDFIIELEEVTISYTGPRFAYDVNAVTRKYYTAKNPDYANLVSLIMCKYGCGYSAALSENVQVYSSPRSIISNPNFSTNVLPNISTEELATKVVSGNNYIVSKEIEYDGDIIRINDPVYDKNGVALDKINYVALPISNDVVPFIIKY